MLVPYAAEKNPEAHQFCALLCLCECALVFVEGDADDHDEKNDSLFLTV